jgi:hypothetical protein
MATNFPTSKDNFVNPQSTDSVQVVSHAAQHTNANDAIEALETKVGIDGSTDPESLEYRLTNYEPAKISFTPPTDPLVGHIWFDNETAEFYFFDGTYWIQGAAPQGTDLLHVASNIVPGTDNTYYLGSTSKRWKGVYIGPGTIYITDTVTGLDAQLTVTNGVLKIDGANQLQVGQLKFVDNTIESTELSTDIEIGQLEATGDVIFNRNIVLGAGKTLEFPDNSVQTTAYIVPVDTTFTVSGGTDGNAPIFNGTPLFSGSYVKNGDSVTFRIKVLMTNITNFGTGQYYVDLPIASKYDYKFRTGCLHDISAGKDYEIGGHVSAGSSRLYLSSVDTQSGTVFDIDFTHNSPITLSTNDNFHIGGTYIV